MLLLANEYLLTYPSSAVVTERLIMSRDRQILTQCMQIHVGWKPLMEKFFLRKMISDYTLYELHKLNAKQCLVPTQKYGVGLQEKSTDVRWPPDGSCHFSRFYFWTEKFVDVEMVSWIIETQLITQLILNLTDEWLGCQLQWSPFQHSQCQPDTFWQSHGGLAGRHVWSLGKGC